MTGWDWQALRSRWVAFDFDSLTTHAKGAGLSKEELKAVKEAAKALSYVEVRRSTGGAGIHLYVYFDAAGIPCENHTVHAALARCILGRMSSDTGFDFASQIDCCGSNMWVWARKMTPENHGLERIKAATQVLSEADLPTNWRDHIEVVTRKRSKVRVNGIADDSDLSPFEALASSRKIIPLDASHRKQIEALQQSGFTTLWIDDHHLLQTHTCALKALRDGPDGAALKLIGPFETNSEGHNPGNPNCFLFPLLDGGWRVLSLLTRRGRGQYLEPGRRGLDHLLLQPLARPADGGHAPRRLRRPGQDRLHVQDARRCCAGRQDAGPDHRSGPNLRRPEDTLKTHKDGRMVMEIERKKVTANSQQNL